MSWPSTAKDRFVRSASTSLPWPRGNASLRSATEPAIAWCNWRRRLDRKARDSALIFRKECRRRRELDCKKNIWSTEWIVRGKPDQLEPPAETFCRAEASHRRIKHQQFVADVEPSAGGLVIGRQLYRGLKNPAVPRDSCFARIPPRDRHMHPCSSPQIATREAETNASATFPPMPILPAWSVHGWRRPSLLTPKAEGRRQARTGRRERPGRELVTVGRPSARLQETGGRAGSSASIPRYARCILGVPCRS